MRKEHMALFRTLLTPTNDPLPCLMMGVGLLLPDVNLLFHSCKQGGHLVGVVISFSFS